MMTHIVSIWIFLFFVFSLGMPNVFADQPTGLGIASLIDKSKSVEAIEVLNGYKTQVEDCLASHATTAFISCAGLSPFLKSTYFTYAFDPKSIFVDNATYATDNYTIVATPNDSDASSNTGVIMLIRNNGTFTCQGTGSYTGAC
jgi:hypothetical protein